MAGQEVQRAPRFVSALRFDTLTRLYDPVVRITTREDTVKEALLAAAQLHGARRLLDVGCGTGTLLLRASREFPDLELVGVDPDPKILDIAHGKTAGRAGIEFVRGISFALPFADGGFDRVVSSLMFHHLDIEAKRRTAHEVARVLAPGGQFVVADWDVPANLLMRLCFLPVQVLDGFSNTNENLRGELARVIEEAGFARGTRVQRFATVFGTLAIHHWARAD